MTATMPAFDLSGLTEDHNWVGLNNESTIVCAMPDKHVKESTFDVHFFGLDRWYVAGPMRGYEKWNFPAFDAARDRLIKMGIQVVSPADLDRVRGITEETTDFDPDEFAKAIRIDTHAILCCTGIYMLKGWEKSTGARYEKMLAQTFKIEITYEPEAVVADVGLSIAGSLP